jgi:hypothetical protein
MVIWVLKSANGTNNMSPCVHFIVKGKNEIKKTKKNPKYDRNHWCYIPVTTNLTYTGSEKL